MSADVVLPGDAIDVFVVHIASRYLMAVAKLYVRGVV